MEKVFQKIKNLSVKLMEEQCTFSRADLAYELKDYGITNDSIEVSKLVYDAYLYYNQDGIIKASFVSNDGYNLLVDEYMTNELLSHEDKSALTTRMNQRLAKADNSLKSLTRLTNSHFNTNSSESTSISGIITGTKGVTDTQAKAKSLLTCYTRLIDSYAEARQDVRNIMCDFVAIREDVLNIYTQYVMCLYDIFGDSIKKIAPQLFDYNQVEFLDVEGMLQATTLKYDELSEHCASLISEISENFNLAVKQSVANYKSMGNSKGLGLAMAGLTMLSHYFDAQEKATRCKSELEVLKGDMNHDTTKIRADYGRLALIYKTLNDLYIPKAETFYRYADCVLSKELQYLLNAIYSNPTTHELFKKRSELLEESKRLDRAIADCKIQIDYYTEELKAASHFLSTKKDEYQLAKSSKPSKPFFLFNLLSLGQLKKTYYRHMYNWQEVYYPVIVEFENFKETMELDKQELESQKVQLEKSAAQLKRINAQLHQNQSSMKNQLSISDDLRLKMLKHLQPLVELLHIAKEIVESKLDQRYMKTVSIQDCRNTDLPTYVVNAIHSFTEELGQSLYIQEEDSEEQIELQIRMNQLKAKQNEIIQQGVHLFDSWIQLKQQQEQGAITRNAYDMQLKQIQEEFALSMADIEHQSLLLSETISKIKTAKSDDQLRAGLLSLSAGKINLTQKDLDDFLQGKRQIIL